MELRETPLDGAWLIDLARKGDSRGFFARLFCEQEFADAGFEAGFVQINDLLSARAGTLRGLHYQLPSFTEEIGRASCWDRVCQYVYILVVAAFLKHTTNHAILLTYSLNNITYLT